MQSSEAESQVKRLSAFLRQSGRRFEHKLISFVFLFSYLTRANDHLYTHTLISDDATR